MMKHFLNKFNRLFIKKRKYGLSYVKGGLWFRVPRVASTSIERALRMDNSYYRGTFTQYWHILHRSDFKFAFVRNPRTRFLSAYYFNPLGVLDNNTLEVEELLHSFLKGENLDIFQNQHFRPQVELIDVNYVDFIGKFENLEHDFKMVTDRLGIPYNLRHFRNSDINWDGQKLDGIKELYKKDYELWRSL